MLRSIRSSGLTTRTAALLIVGALSMQGCVTSGSSASLTPEEQKLRQKSESFNTTMAEGAMAGALLGGLIGAFAGGNGRGALVGAGLGTLAGTGAGYYIANKKEQYANEEERLDVMIADVRADNTKLADYLTTVEKVIAEDKSRIVALRTGMNGSKQNAKELGAALASAQDNRKVMAESLDSLQKKRSEYQSALAESKGTGTASVHELEREIATWTEQVARLEAGIKSLDEAIAISPVS